MIKKLKKWWLRKQLKDPDYSFLFEEDTGKEVIVFDTETTGLDPKKDEIVSIGAVKVKGNKILTSELLSLAIKPQGAISPESIKIHRIRHCDVAQALTPREAAEAFLRFAGSRTLVGYYVEFDVAMLERIIKPWLGISLPNRIIDVSGLYYDKKIGLIPQGNIDLRFDTILKELGIPSLKSHDAVNDAIMTAMIYLKLQHTKKL